MDGKARAVIGVVAVVVIVAAVFLIAGSGNAGEEEGACCLTNPAYHGVCRIVPAGGETCEGILEYLNTPNSSGKAYCGNTQIRGGWRLVECPDE